MCYVTKIYYGRCNKMDEKILASVNGKNITEADIDAALAAMGPNAQRFNNPQGRAMLLEQLIELMHQMLVLLVILKAELVF